MNTTDAPNRTRRSIRLPDYDYGTPGAYFVTICCHERNNFLGEVAQGGVDLSEVGIFVEGAWRSLPDHFSFVKLDAYVIMPNHVHGILWISETPRDSSDPTDDSRNQKTETRQRSDGPRRGTLSSVIGSIKSASTRMIRSQGFLREGKLWQRNYYEHIIRNDESLMRIREYIQMNPLRWEYDGENPSVNRAPGMKPHLEWQDVLYGATHASPVMGRW